MMYLPISLTVASLPLWQSYDCPTASEDTLKFMGKIHKKTKNCALFLVHAV